MNLRKQKYLMTIV